MIDELPRKGEVATEFRALAGAISEEVFATLFPNIARVLRDYQENIDDTFSETASGTRSVETQSGQLESSVDSLNFQLDILKAYQLRSEDLLENIKKAVENTPSTASLLGGLLGRIFRGAKKPPAGKTSEKGKPGKTRKIRVWDGVSRDAQGKKIFRNIEVPESRVSTGVGIFSKVTNLVAVVLAVNEAIQRVRALDPKDPDYNKKATQEVSSVVTRFAAAGASATVVGAIAGAILGSAAPGIGNVIGFAGGLIAGIYTDLYFGDDIEKITKSIIDKIWEEKSSKPSAVPTNKNLTSLAAPTSNVMTNALGLLAPSSAAAAVPPSTLKPTLPESSTAPASSITSTIIDRAAAPAYAGPTPVVAGQTIVPAAAPLPPLVQSVATVSAPSKEDDFDEVIDITVAKDMVFTAKKMKFVGDKLFFTNVTAGARDKKDTAFKFKRKEENKTSQKVEELKEKSESATKVDSSGKESGTTPGGSSGGGTPGSAGGGGGGTPGSAGGGSTPGSVGNLGNTPTGPAFTGNQDEAFKKIEEAAKAAGSPDPKLTASIAMLESGWLKSRMARGNNPFGQTITRGQIGSNGIIDGTVGADGQLHAVYDSLESAVKHHVAKWGGRYDSDPKAALGNLVRGGYNTVNPAWASSVYSIYKRGAAAAERVASNDNAPQTSQQPPQQQTPSPTGNASTTQGSTPGQSPQQPNQATVATQQQPATAVPNPPARDGVALSRSSAQAVTTPAENTEETGQRLQQIITNSGGGQQRTVSTSREVVTTDGSPARAEVSVRDRLVQHFTNE